MNKRNSSAESGSDSSIFSYFHNKSAIYFSIYFEIIFPTYSLAAENADWSKISSSKYPKVAIKRIDINKEMHRINNNGKFLLQFSADKLDSFPIFKNTSSLSEQVHQLYISILFSVLR